MTGKKAQEDLGSPRNAVLPVQEACDIMQYIGGPHGVCGAGGSRAVV